MSSNSFVCIKCALPRVFETKKQENAHYQEHHSKTLRITIKKGVTSVTHRFTRSINGFKCHCCDQYYPTKSAMRKHLERSGEIHEDSSSDDCQDEPSEDDMLSDRDDDGGPRMDSGGASNKVVEEMPTSTVPTCAATMGPSSSDAMDPATIKRTFEQAMLLASDQMDEPERHRRNAVQTLKMQNLAPFSIVMTDGVELNGLAAPSVIKVMLMKTPERIEEVAQDTSAQCTCGSAAIFRLGETVLHSPYKDFLATRQFEEMSKKTSDLLNRDWTEEPQMRYATAQAFAGAILFNSRIGQAALLLTVEAYGRQLLMDPHRERTLESNGWTSYPPSTLARYPGIWPTTCPRNEGDRLIIGARPFNILATSVLRLDTRDKLSVGGVCRIFRLIEKADSQATQIFFDKGSLERAHELSLDPTAWAVSREDRLSQVRQLRSKFDELGTFELCRASSSFTTRPSQMPYSIYTLQQFEKNQRGAGVAGSLVFHHIAWAVIRDKRDAKLRKMDVESALDFCNPKSVRVRECLINIIGLFNENKEIKIIGNTDLNEQLMTLAACLSKSISKANLAVANEIWTSAFN